MRNPTIILAALLAAACGNNSPDSAQAGEASAPSAAGRAAFSQCAVCHSVKEGEPHRIGPNLFGVYGRTAGAAEGFGYSSSMRAAGVVWTDETLDAFLANPQDFIRGNRMAFAGAPDEQMRAAIIAYLKTLQPESN